MACLDTSTLLDLSGRSGASRKHRVRERLASFPPEEEELVTTRFNVAELWVGVERSRDPEAEAERVGRLTGPLRILEFDEQAARVFGHIVGYLQARGLPVGDMDALIASVCLVHGHSIVTRNLRHFTPVPGLAVEGY